MDIDRVRHLDALAIAILTPPSRRSRAQRVLLAMAVVADPELVALTDLLRAVAVEEASPGRRRPSHL